MGAVVFFIGHISADLLWYVLVAEAVWKGRRLMSDRIYRGMIGACAIFLLVLGAGFIRYGVIRWSGGSGDGLAVEATTTQRAAERGSAGMTVGM